VKAKTQWLILVISVFSSVSNAEIYKCLTDGRDAKYQNSPCSESKQTEEKVNLPTLEHKQITLKQVQGHYFMTGEINGMKSIFLIDTGASIIALPESFANKARVICSGKFVTSSTANGDVRACIANVSKLSLSPFEFKNVEVLIHPNLEMPLLGMSVLQKFNIEQRNGEMHFSER
jgi:clan AA aspartic protease (TIGR02281 family)